MMHAVGSRTPFAGTWAAAGLERRWRLISALRGGKARTNGQRWQWKSLASQQLMSSQCHGTNELQVLVKRNRRGPCGCFVCQRHSLDVDNVGLRSYVGLSAGGWDGELMSFRSRCRSATIRCNLPRVQNLRAQCRCHSSSSPQEIDNDDLKAAHSGNQCKSLPPRSAYVHIPFCRRRCYYCDFPISVVGKKSDPELIGQGMADYVTLVCKEAKVTAMAVTCNPRRDVNLTTSNNSITLADSLNTVSFGGGTPSLLPPSLMGKILDNLAANYGIANDAEISMEIDPGTFNGDRLKAYEKCGVNRFSMGVQAFQPALLSSCGRSHDVDDVYDAINAFHEAGIQNWSIDLIGGLPNQTIDDWHHSLAEAVRAEPAHVSIYDLQVEERTPFGRWYKPGQSPLPSDDLAANMYRDASIFLREAGYEHYEISNYAKPGFESRHNLVYWRNESYYGFGMGAASYVDGKRYTRPKKMTEYASWVNAYVANGGLIEWPVDGIEDRLLDRLMLNLRLGSGLNLRSFEAEFGRVVMDVLKGELGRFMNGGLVLVLGEDGQPIAYQTDGFAETGRVDPDMDSQSLPFPDWQTAKICEKSKQQEMTDPWRKPSAQERERDVWEQAAWVRLSDPEGFLVSNEVIASLFSALSNLSANPQTTSRDA